MATSSAARKIYEEFRELPARERADFLRHLLRSKKMRDDLFDLALIERSRQEEGVDMAVEEYHFRRAARRSAP